VPAALLARDRGELLREISIHDLRELLGVAGGRSPKPTAVILRWTHVAVSA